MKKHSSFTYFWCEDYKRASAKINVQFFKKSKPDHELATFSSISHNNSLFHHTCFDKLQGHLNNDVNVQEHMSKRISYE